MARLPRSGTLSVLCERTPDFEKFVVGQLLHSILIGLVDARTAAAILAAEVFAEATKSASKHVALCTQGASHPRAS
jgi:hypothetical protein